MRLFFTNVSRMEFWVIYSALFCLFSVIDKFEWPWVVNLCNNIQLKLVFFKAPFLILHFPLYFNDLPDDGICNIAISADDTGLS